MKNIIILFAFFVTAKGFSQDQLFKKDNTKLMVKIFEINPTEIVYKLFSYPDGPKITILKSEVALIIYQNGTHEVINSTSHAPIVKVVAPSNKEEKNLNLETKLSTKNNITINLLEPVNGCIGLTYTRELVNHHFNVCIPIIVGITTPFVNQAFANADYSVSYKYDHLVSDFKFSRKIVDIGLGVNFQTSPQRATTYFVGPLVTYSKFNGSYVVVKYDNSQYININHEFVLERWNIMINNGFLIKVGKNFSIILNAAFGYKKQKFITNDPTQYGSNHYFRNILSSPINASKLGMSIGYRF